MRCLYDCLLHVRWRQEMGSPQVVMGLVPEGDKSWDGGGDAQAQAVLKCWRSQKGLWEEQRCDSGEVKNQRRVTVWAQELGGLYCKSKQT
jgi:hypothetical protein